ncbi:MAG: RNA polymerase sigma factor, partial [Clostridiales bacterium]|nr:RNA polymerase sigma factor [Clostridiales bacterium]
DWDFAEEITQEAFVKAFEMRHDLRDPRSFLRWVTRIAIRHGNRQARLNLLRYNPLPAESEMRSIMFSTYQGPPQSDAEEFVRSWLFTLEKADRQMIQMKYGDLMTHLEISRITNKSISTIKRRLSHIRSMLEEALRKEWHYPSI